MKNIDLELLALKIFVAIIFIIFILILLHKALTIKIGSTVDERTIEVCKQLTEENKRIYAGTKYQDLDFYQSCIDNIRYTSPLHN